MRTKTIAVKTLLNDVDRRLILLAIQSNAFERAAAERAPAQIAYWGQRARLSYTEGLKQIERRLRILATKVGGWELRLDAAFEPVPVPWLYRKAGLVPPPGIRNLQMNNDFFLIRIAGRFSVADSMSISSARLALSFGGGGRPAALQPAVHAFFPKAGVRRYGKADVLAGLRSTLQFWVAVTPGGTLIEDVARIPEKVRADLVYGPVNYRFGRTRAAGAGGGRPRLEWYFSGESVTDGADFENLLVLRVAKGSKSFPVDATVEASVTLPAELQPILGRSRLLRGSRSFVLPVA